VAVMGGGMGNTFICSGSNVFIVNFEDIENPGSIFGAAKNKGPLNIVDTDPAGVNPGMENHIATPNGSDIANAIPASPVVITPDLARGIPWRGAMVYINDLEGKITKINCIYFAGNNNFDSNILKSEIKSKTKNLSNIFANNNFKLFQIEGDAIRITKLTLTSIKPLFL
jgi:hypothetical protein